MILAACSVCTWTGVGPEGVPCSASCSGVLHMPRKVRGLADALRAHLGRELGVEVFVARGWGRATEFFLNEADDPIVVSDSLLSEIAHDAGSLAVDQIKRKLERGKR